MVSHPNAVSRIQQPGQELVMAPIEVEHGPDELVVLKPCHSGGGAVGVEYTG